MFARILSTLKKSPETSPETSDEVNIVLDNTLVPQLDSIKYEEVRGKKLAKSGVAHEFLSLIHLAYMKHLTPIISPDDVWLTILSEFAKHVNDNDETVEFYRKHFADPNNPNKKTEIIVELLPSSFESIWNKEGTPEILANVFANFLGQVNTHATENKVLSQMIADFSTSTTITRLTSQVATAYMVEEYYSMKMIMSCGFPSIKILGTQDDWKSVLNKINAFASLGHPNIKNYANNCNVFVNNILSTYTTGINKTLWNDFYGSHTCGSGGQKAYHGWCLHLLNKKINEAWDPYDEQTTRINYKFKIATDYPKPLEKELNINIGPSGVDMNSETNTVRLYYDYFIEDAKERGLTFNDNPIKWSKIKWDELSSLDNFKLNGKSLFEQIIDSSNLFNDYYSSTYGMKYEPICIAYSYDGWNGPIEVYSVMTNLPTHKDKNDYNSFVIANNINFGRGKLETNSSGHSPLEVLCKAFPDYNGWPEITKPKRIREIKLLYVVPNLNDVLDKAMKIYTPDY